ncbi:hypothetical protein ES708_28294 [subsurface metagenome]
MLLCLLKRRSTEVYDITYARTAAICDARVSERASAEGAATGLEGAHQAASAAVRAAVCVCS